MNNNNVLSYYNIRVSTMNDIKWTRDRRQELEVLCYKVPALHMKYSI